MGGKLFETPHGADLGARAAPGLRFLSGDTVGILRRTLDEERTTPPRPTPGPRTLLQAVAV